MKTRNLVLAVVAVVVVALVAARAYAPIYVKDKINSVLAEKVVDYDASVADVRLSILSGSYALVGFQMRPKNAPEGREMVKIREILIDLSWRALFKGRVMLDTTLIEPQLLLYDGVPAGQAAKDQGLEKMPSWKETFDALIPFQLQTLTVRQGLVLFRNPQSKPPIEVALDNIDGQVRNIGNIIPALPGELPAAFSFASRLQGHAQFLINGTGDLLASPFHVKVDGDLRELQVKTLNLFFREYGKFDLTEGTLSLKARADTAWPKMDALIVASGRGIDVIAPAQRYQGVLGFFTEWGVAFTNLVTKDRNEVVRSEVKITGAWPELKVDIGRAVRTLLTD